MEPGIHTLQFTIDWCGCPTVTFMAAEGETKYFDISAFWNSHIIAPLALVVISGNVASMLFFNFYGLNILLALLFAGVVYLLTLGKDKYLTLKEGTAKLAL